MCSVSLGADVKLTNIRLEHRCLCYFFCHYSSNLEDAKENPKTSNEQVVQNGLLSIHNQAWRDDVYVDKTTASRSMMARLRCIDKLKNSMEVFLLLFGDGLLELILNSTNQNLPHGTMKMTKAELVRYLGMQLAISTTSGFARDDFWTSGGGRRCGVHRPITLTYFFLKLDFY